MKTFALAAVSALAIIAATPAAAASINFDTLPNGTTLSQVNETLIGDQYASLGVTFQGIYTDGTAGLPVATTYAAGPAGPNYSGNYLGNAQTGTPFITTPSFAFTPRFETLRISFANGASGISLSHNDFALFPTTTFNAYDAGDNLLQTFTVNDGNGWAIRSITASNVYRLDLVSSVSNVGRNYFGIDNLNFTPNAIAAVPESATWGLMLLGFGLIGAGLRPRRRSTTVTYA